MDKAEMVAIIQHGGDRVTLRQADAIADDLLAAIATSIAAGARVVLKGVGIFSTKSTSPRVGRNPRTGVEVEIAAGRRVNFKPALALKRNLAAAARAGAAGQ